ncbi:DNA-binding NarL/FixJ family response regulator [Herbihabitans rhizosphaerae]|uniref:DNA-binding NarL/FixJ family response regulator n=1 Tax=Herbihabitans rhizosphaerae TaxID=1872711 RepID=A0A4Q7KMC3_9PSEU|nr:response regulator transcription factor [Herbihabitans rhizosphaerae]RZS37828.1 DNA-binding NarL/FixJ family response regulator [Herbihabitans rhizosphaerae]
MARGADQRPDQTARPRRSAAPNGGIGVALIDGVPLFREGLSALVMRTAGLRWIGAADSPSVAMQMCERLRPNVVLVDSGLDPRNQLSRMLVGSDTDLAVILLVRDSHRNTQYVANGIAAGVAGVLLRSSEPPQIVDAIRAVYDRRRHIDPALTSMVTAPGARTPHNNTNGDGLRPLSQREYQVLHLIADGLENQAIAKILYVSVETVRTHVKSILRKLAARDRTHAVAVAFRSGVLVAPRDMSHAEQSPHRVVAHVRAGNRG